MMSCIVKECSNERTLRDYPGVVAHGGGGLRVFLEFNRHGTQSEGTDSRPERQPDRIVFWPRYYPPFSSRELHCIIDHGCPSLRRDREATGRLAAIVVEDDCTNHVCVKGHRV